MTTGTDLTRHEGANLPERMKYAQALASASLLPRAYQQSPGNVLLAMELGDALGIPPIQAITGIHVIEGRPSASADLIASLVRKAGHKLRVSGDDHSATAQIIRADDKDFTYESVWTIDRAKAAGLANKGVWKSYPAAMLKARAITEVARAGASDALYGVVYTSEELGAEADAGGAVLDHQSPRREPVRSGNARLAAVVQQAEATTTPAEQADDVGGAADDVSDAPEAMTQAQSRKMGALMRENGLTERADALAYVGGQIGREIKSRNELSKAEAHAVIDALERLDESAPDGEATTEYPAVGASEHDADGEALWPEPTEPGTDRQETVA